MASIGGYSFITLDGGLNPGTGEQLEEITRPGVDGVSFRKIGKRGVPFRQKSLVDVSSSNNAKNLVLNYKKLQGTLVSFTDNAGITWNNVMVLRVQVQQPRFVRGMSGGISGAVNGYLIDADWLLQMTEIV